jgi:DNA polymerase-3 subunit delta'
MSLKEIFCQDGALRLLHKAFAIDKVPHAYIFAGPEGVGKYKTACEWAKLLLCKNPITEQIEGSDFADPSSAAAAQPLPLRRVDSCGLCQSCRLFEAGSHPDFNSVYKELLEFTIDGKGKTTPLELPIDVIREFLVAKVSTRPTLSQRKVFVVSESEKLNAASQNCLLKVLEEPPIYCCIILLCTRLERLLPTTRSRCQIIRFGPIDTDRIEGKLQQMGIEQKIAVYFARLAGGSLGAASQWAKLQLAGANLYEIKNKLISSVADYELADALDLAGQFLDDAKRIAGIWADLDKTISKSDIEHRAPKILIRIIISALYDVMKLNITPADEATNFDQQEQIKKLAGRFGPQPVVSSAEKIADCYTLLRWLEDNVNERLIFEQLLLNLVNSGRIKV